MRPHPSWRLAQLLGLTLAGLAACSSVPPAATPDGGGLDAALPGPDTPSPGPDGPLDAGSDAARPDGTAPPDGDPLPGDMALTPLELQGEAVYRSPLSDGNTFACATCHAIDEPAADGLRRPGHRLRDAALRATYKDGHFNELLDAVNTCVDQWQGAPVWTEDEPRWLALQAYLRSLAGDGAPGSAPAVDIQIVSPPTDLTGGDAARGRTRFNTACIVCHGQDATGTERAPSLVAEELEADYVGLRIRLSGSEQSAVYPGLAGGRMPFWGADRLTDAEVRDLVAFVVSLQTPPDGGPGDGGADGPPGDASTDGGGDGGPDAGADGADASGCGSDHPRVGQTAVLVQHYHGVSGTARVRDNCTLVLEDFTYDGGGIDVRVYGGLAGDFTNGFALTADIKGMPFSGQDLVMPLPAGRTLDDLDGLSVWCVAARVSFGEGQLR